jgi:hypothetical protein
MMTSSRFSAWATRFHDRDDVLVVCQDASKVRQARPRLRKTQRQAAVRFLDIIQRGAEDDLPLVNHGHVVRHALHFMQQVGTEQDGSPLVGNGTNDRFKNVAPHERIQTRRIRAMSRAF